jgi:2-iminobutanoate/2-iminopropanoate deaminase
MRGDLYPLPMTRWTPVQLPPGTPGPLGPYTPALRAGDFVYVSGQTPRNPRTGEKPGNDVATQTRQVLSNVQWLLEQAGASMADVVSVTVYLARIEDWAAMNSVYAEFFTKPFPTRTTVGAELRDILVEVSAVAYAKVGP